MTGKGRKLLLLAATTCVAAMGTGVSCAATKKPAVADSATRETTRKSSPAAKSTTAKAAEEKMSAAASKASDEKKPATASKTSGAEKKSSSAKSAAAKKSTETADAKKTVSSKKSSSSKRTTAKAETAAASRSDKETKKSEDLLKATAIATPAPVVGPPPAPAPTDLRIRIIGTASFQGRQTALIEDLNTLSDSFYKVGDPIYGYKITTIAADGIHLEKDGKKSFVAFAPTSIRARTGEETGEGSNGVVIANTYLPTDRMQASAPRPNFYLDTPGGASSTKWDLFSGSSKSKAPSMSGSFEGAVASAAKGLFAMPISNFKRLSSGFGYRKHPIGGGTKMHKGLDLSANRGTRILAADSGKVRFAGWKGGYGYCVIIDHLNGYETLYGHCSKLIADVGDNVRRSDLIAEVGSTGASTGNHLHFEVHKNGTAIDPEPFLEKYL